MGWREWLIERLSRPEQQQPEDTTQNIRVDSVQAEQQGIAVGINNGGSVTVFNQPVPDSIVQLHADKIGLHPERARQISYDFLADIEKYYRYLPFKGMGKTDQLRLGIPLVELFTPLNARLTLPSGDRLEDDLRLAGRKLSEEETEQLGGRLGTASSVLELIVKYPVLVILGDPGSGKSTVVRFLAFLLATGQGEPFGLSEYLPLLLPLAAYSDRLSQQPDLSLRRFAVEYFQSRMDLDDLQHLLDARLDQGKVLILLDGLDEVKEIHQRNVVVDRVQQFLCRHIAKGNRVIMTSRIIGYQEVRPAEIEGLRECTLLDFDEDEVTDFIRRWTVIIEAHAYEDERVSRYEADREAKELIVAVQENNGISRLAANPLLLTMLVIQKRQGISLPRHRVMLYEQYIQSLLHDWLLARSQHNSPMNLPDDLQLRKVLEPLAWWMQVSEPGKGLVNEADLLNWLKGFFKDRVDPEGEARGFIKDVRENSGLLLDRGGNQYGFMHLTFMEYLAGIALANHFQKNLQVVVDLIVNYAAQAEWRETILLAINYLGIKQKFDRVTTDLLLKLLDTSSSDPGIHYEIVAASLADMGKIGVTDSGWLELRERLVAEGMHSSKIPAKRRVMIGKFVDEAGDPRQHLMDVDAMCFCMIPAGDFFLGSSDADEMAETDEKLGAGFLELGYDYAIARYPITVAQFRQFVVEADNHPKVADCLRGLDNTPIVYVSWNDVIAFCDWMTFRWQEKGWLPEGWRVDLPSEPEWEKAARGGLKIPMSVENKIQPSELIECLSAAPELADNNMPQRCYPWGDDIDEEKLNYGRNIDNVSSIGCYPKGISPYGCDEMSGNVWEWTRSLYEEDYSDAAGLWQRSDARKQDGSLFQYEMSLKEVRISNMK